VASSRLSAFARRLLASSTPERRPGRDHGYPRSPKRSRRAAWQGLSSAGELLESDVCLYRLEGTGRTRRPMIGHRRALDGRQKPTMLPNLIIIGAGKCGTTALHYYLQEHPQIYMSTRKELRFFSGENWERGLTWYEAHFDSSCPVRGEASPQYTVYPGLPDAPQRMHAVIPDAKLIYLVRDPIDRIVSDYVHAYAARWENKPFRQAVAASLANRYVSASRYFMQLEQYLHYFSPDRIMIINRQDLLVHRRRTLRAVFRFLGVNEQFDSPRFNEIRNPSCVYRQRIVGLRPVAYLGKSARR
jgi:hypothetical protein